MIVYTKKDVRDIGEGVYNKTLPCLNLCKLLSGVLLWWIGVLCASDLVF